MVHAWPAPQLPPSQPAPMMRPLESRFAVAFPCNWLHWSVLSCCTPNAGNVNVPDDGAEHTKPAKAWLAPPTIDANAKAHAIPATARKRVCLMTVSSLLFQ